jgi:hypothetical protein
MCCRRGKAFLLCINLLLAFVAWAQDLKLPNKPGSLRFAIIGDSGTGDRMQLEVAQKLSEYSKIFPFTFVLMMGDNMYGRERPKDYIRKFELPYKPLLDAGVQFYATLGNHDNADQRFYKLFHMGGQYYYTFKAGAAQFFSLNSNYVDQGQLEWTEREVCSSKSVWKIAFFHHPLYSSGRRHGSDLELRKVLEPIFTKCGIDAAFSGHEHFYARIKPQKGIHYFISGAAAKLRRGNIRESPLTAAGFDQDRSFMLIEIAGNDLYFQTISRTGETVDSGVISKTNATLILAP